MHLDPSGRGFDQRFGKNARRTNPVASPEDEVLCVSDQQQIGFRQAQLLIFVWLVRDVANFVGSGRCEWREIKMSLFAKELGFAFGSVSSSPLHCLVAEEIGCTRSLLTCLLGLLIDCRR